ncbi:unnamed protein product [Alternaria alternata]
MHQIAKTSSNLIPPGDDVSQYSKAEIKMRVYGSKLVLVVEQMQLLTIWLVKACLLIMYNRMTLVLPQHKIVVATSIYVAVAFVVMEVLYLGVWCRPFNQYWAVPPNSMRIVHTGLALSHERNSPRIPTLIGQNPDNNKYLEAFGISSDVQKVKKT